MQHISVHQRLDAGDSVTIFMVLSTFKHRDVASRVFFAIDRVSSVVFRESAL